MHRLSSLMQTLMRSRRAVWQLVISGVSCKWSSTTSTCNTASPLSMGAWPVFLYITFLYYFFTIYIDIWGLKAGVVFLFFFFFLMLLLSFLWWVRHGQKNVKLKCVSMYACLFAHLRHGQKNVKLKCVSMYACLFAHLMKNQRSKPVQSGTFGGKSSVQ